MRIFGKEKCKFIANFSATMVTSLPSLSLCLYLSLSLSPKVPHAQYRKRFRASYNSPLKVRVCKKTFVETIAISASRVDRLLGKKVRNPVRLSDQRGRQKNARKVSEERLHFVREHIKSFPAEESHYSRTENPAAQYLSGDLTLAHMYRLYVQRCTEEEKLPVKESFYRNVFMTEFNLRFKKPRSDTCKTCEESEDRGYR